MRRFLAGFATAVILLVLAVGALLLTAGEPVAEAEPPNEPVPTGPRDLADDETWLAGVDLTAARVLGPGGSFRDVSARGTDVRLGAEGLTAGRLDLTATLPYAAASRQVGDDVTITPASDGRARITRRLEVAGRAFDVAAIGTVRAEDGLLVIEPDEVDLGGPTVLDRALSVTARRLVTIRQRLEGVPRGMALRSVQVRRDGFRARLVGSDVRIGQQ